MYTVNALDTGGDRVQKDLLVERSEHLFGLEAFTHFHSAERVCQARTYLMFFEVRDISQCPRRSLKNGFQLGKYIISAFVSSQAPWYVKMARKYGM